MGEKGEPVTFAVFAKSNEYPTPIRISGYSGTMDEIRQQVLGRARREGFRGDFVERMADLGWWLEPLMTVAQHERIVAGLEARIAEQDEWLSEVMRERDWAQECLQKTHIALGGDGEWTGKMPSEMPPDSGDLHYDVPWLAAEVMADARRMTFLADNKLCITPIDGGGWDVYRYGDGCVESLVATATTFTGAIDRARDAFLAQTAEGVEGG